MAQSIIGNLINTGVISANEGQILLVSLNNAFAAKTPQAKSNMLGAMVNKIEALVKSGRLSAGDADNLINVIEQLK